MLASPAEPTKLTHQANTCSGLNISMHNGHEHPLLVPLCDFDGKVQELVGWGGNNEVPPPPHLPAVGIFH
eukprot:8882102-Ditylum_brightwellii.AAC.1